jgi:hypothetical protein
MVINTPAAVSLVLCSELISKNIRIGHQMYLILGILN